MVHILYNPSSNCGFDTKVMLDTASACFEESECVSLFDIADLIKNSVEDGQDGKI